MKLFAYLALFGLASAQSLPEMGLDLEEEDLTESLDITLSRWAERRIERKAEAVDQAMRYYTRPSRETYIQGMQDLNEIFGTDVMKAGQHIAARYGPSYMGYAQSHFASDQVKFKEEVFNKSAGQMKLMQDIEILKNDLGMARGRSLYRPDDIGIRPNTDNMSRFQQEKARVEGVHIENDDLKDVFEDLQDITHDLSTLYDPSNPDIIKMNHLAGAARYSKDIQKIKDMLLEDLEMPAGADVDGTSKNDRIGMGFMKLIKERDIAGKMVETMGNDAHFQRLVKSVERMLRAACKGLQIKDLPTGERKQAVNKIASFLYSKIKGDQPVEEIKGMTVALIKGFLRGWQQFAERNAAVEREVAPKMI